MAGNRWIYHQPVQSQGNYQNRHRKGNRSQQHVRGQARGNQIIKNDVPDEYVPIYPEYDRLEERGIEASKNLYEYLLSIGLKDQDEYYPKEVDNLPKHTGEDLYVYKKRIRSIVKEQKNKVVSAISSEKNESLEQTRRHLQRPARNERENDRRGRRAQHPAVFLHRPRRHHRTNQKHLRMLLQYR